MITNPYTGKQIDYDEIPVYNPSGQMGKFCSVTGHPLNRIAILSYPYGAFGNAESNAAIAVSHETAVSDVENQLKAYPIVDESFTMAAVAPSFGLKLVLTKANPSAIAAVAGAPIPEHPGNTPS